MVVSSYRRGVLVIMIDMRGDDAQVDHVFVVDVGRREVWDFVEMKSMKLRDVVFSACVGDEA